MSEKETVNPQPVEAVSSDDEAAKVKAAEAGIVDDTLAKPEAAHTTTSKIVHTPGADEALDILNAAGNVHRHVDPAESRRLLRKIDLHVMPLICLIYFLQYIDKGAVSYASVTGLLTATHLKGDDFNWVASIFFFGQLAFEFPTIRLIQLFPLAKYTSVNVTLWGLCLACLAACKNYSGLLACRFFLGVLEAAVVPAWVVFTSQWYTKDEQAVRVGVWFSMCGAAQMFGGYFAYGVSKHVGGDVNAKLEGWQVIFLFLGLFTACVGISFWFIMPDSPAHASFLSDDDKVLLLERIRHNEQGIGSQKFKWSQVREALTDPATWLYTFWIFAGNIPNSIATSYGNILVKGMGYSGQESLLLVTPLGAWEIVFLVGLSWLGMRYKERIYFCVLGHIPAIVGAILMAACKNKKGALFGYYTTGGIPLGWTTILGLQASNVAGSTKKITVACIGTIGYTVGNIISPHTFQARDAPRYLPAKIAMCILYFLITVDLLILRWLFEHRNKKRDEERAAKGDDYTVEENHEFFDMTDLQNREFRYAV